MPVLVAKVLVSQKRLLTSSHTLHVSGASLSITRPDVLKLPRRPTAPSLSKTPSRKMERRSIAA
jgi:hypothetical protein